MTTIQKAVSDAAEEICAVYDVAAPRGVHFANRKEVTIGIIIQKHIEKAIPVTDGAFTFAELDEALQTLSIEQRIAVKNGLLAAMLRATSGSRGGSAA